MGFMCHKSGQRNEPGAGPGAILLVEDRPGDSLHCRRDRGGRAGGEPDPGTVQPARADDAEYLDAWRSTFATLWIPLVMTNIAMENYRFEWENPV